MLAQPPSSAIPPPCQLFPSAVRVARGMCPQAAATGTKTYSLRLPIYSNACRSTPFERVPRACFHFAAGQN